MSVVDCDALAQREAPFRLYRNLARLDIFKCALRNSLAIDLRVATRPVEDGQGQVRSERFRYLPELLPFLKPRVAAFSGVRRRAYETLESQAVEAFWNLFVDFQPFAGAVAIRSGVDRDRVEGVLARSLLLYELDRGTAFSTYLEKSLREAIKNLRGKDYAERMGIPVSAGRLIPQIRWHLHREATRVRRSLSVEESEAIVLSFLSEHSARFSPETMRKVARKVREDRPPVSLQNCRDWFEPSLGRQGGDFQPISSYGNDGYLEEADECHHQLQQIHDAISRAGMKAGEAALVLSELDLPCDEAARKSILSGTSPAAIRKRTHRLLVRMLAARYAPQAQRFGKYISATSGPARKTLLVHLEEVGQLRACAPELLVDQILNWMTLSKSVYRLSIAERSRSEEYLVGDRRTLDSVTFCKLIAAFVEQERLGFPCWEEPAAES